MKNIIKAAAVAVTMTISADAWCQEFFDVSTVTCRRSRGASSFKATVDIPVAGPRAVMTEAKKWICNVLDVQTEGNISETDMPEMISRSCDEFLQNYDATSRTVRIVWSYEDPTCVTFEAETTDRDSVRWTTSDVATFSKKDGHRVTAKEIFACGDNRIKELMWQFRGNMQMEVPDSEQLYIGNAGFIDGWIIVIGPARGTSGAEYRIRYQVAEPYLRPSQTGYLAE